jgi:glutamate N-acetyltransferase/amino-acid N-acetyltransferase
MRNGVTYAQGFRADGVACGLKKNGNKDLAVVVCSKGARVTGVFTQNIIKGHSLLLSQKNIASGTAKVVAINSGNANACLGVRGDQDAQKFAQLCADKFSCNASEVLPASTGVIGKPLPLHLIESGLNMLAPTTDGSLCAAQAIMTTDTVPKQAKISFLLNGKEVRIGGMAKGSGMIHPNMATMISVITTDADITTDALGLALKTACDVSFNRISIDGDTSVCDEVVLLSSCLADNETISPATHQFSTFVDALKAVCTELAKKLAADGEGATKLIIIKVSGTKTNDDAHTIANAIAKSPLCKTAAFGNDANWGRLITAAGYSGAIFDPQKVNIFIGDVEVCKNGGGLPFDEAKALKALKKKEVVYTIIVGSGKGADTMYTCDFSHGYISINADYRS